MHQMLHCCQVPRRHLRHFVKKIPLFGEKKSTADFWVNIKVKNTFLVKLFTSTHVLYYLEK